MNCSVTLWPGQCCVSLCLTVSLCLSVSLSVPLLHSGLYCTVAQLAYYPTLLTVSHGIRRYYLLHALSVSLCLCACLCVSLTEVVLSNFAGGIRVNGFVSGGFLPLSFPQSFTENKLIWRYRWVSSSVAPRH